MGYVVKGGGYKTFGEVDVETKMKLHTSKNLVLEFGEATIKLNNVQFIDDVAQFTDDQVDEIVEKIMSGNKTADGKEISYGQAYRMFTAQFRAPVKEMATEGIERDERIKEIMKQNPGMTYRQAMSQDNLNQA
jgi:hypothetical protein